jgi:hypothetical protein
VLSGRPLRRIGLQDIPVFLMIDRKSNLDPHRIKTVMWRL